MWNIEVTLISVVIGALGAVTKGLNKGTGGLGNNKTCGDHPNYGIIVIGQNTEKSPGEFRIFALTQTPVKDHQLTLIWKTQGVNNNYKDNRKNIISENISRIVKT